MPTVRTTDGVTLSFTDEGQGRPVVLVAGFSAPATSWGHQAAALQCVQLALAPIEPPTRRPRW